MERPPGSLPSAIDLTAGNRTVTFIPLVPLNSGAVQSFVVSCSPQGKECGKAEPACLLTCKRTWTTNPTCATFLKLITTVTTPNQDCGSLAIARLAQKAISLRPTSIIFSGTK